VEVQSRGINPWDNHEELMEVVELQRRLEEVKVRAASMVMVDHGMPPS
jgi:hypothetical protein